MKRFRSIEKARFLDRPNRFIVRCSIHGRTVTAYLPNPGRLLELLMPGSVLYLVEQSSPSARIQYLVLAVEKKGIPVMLHTHYTNDVARHLVEADQVPGLENTHVVQPEFTWGRSRFDFLLERHGDTILLEVKSCTLFSRRIAMFPDAITARGRRHLLELADSTRKGMKAAVLFVVHAPQAQFFLPDYHTDLEFAQTLLAVSDRVMIRAVSVGWTKLLNLKKQARNIPVPWEFIKRECHDSGCYILVLHLKKDTSLAIGTAGSTVFRRGYYLYAGSARKALTRRLERHRRKRKNLFWHIDYLRQHADFITALPIRSSDDLECSLAADLMHKADWHIPGFGASDCRCPTHLFGSAGNPLQLPWFIGILMRFRIDRLHSLLETHR